MQAAGRGGIWNLCCLLAFTSGLTEDFRKQEDLPDPLPSLFKESYGIGAVRSVSQPTEGITDWQSRIPQELQSLFTMLSDFQMEILRIYAQSQEAIPVHTVFRQIHKKGYSVQDALASARLLEALGFWKRRFPRNFIWEKKRYGTVQVIPLPYRNIRSRNTVLISGRSEIKHETGILIHRWL